MDIMSLPVMPEEWKERNDVSVLDGCSELREASKTRMETWSVAVLKADKHFVAFRVLTNTSFGYGG